MQILLSISMGIGLSAACGFRVFIPLLLMSIAAKTGHLTLAPGFEWVATYPALIAFATATILEIIGYYVPWVDNILDTIATPAAIIAGIVATASIVTGMSPFFKWTLAVIAGGGVAGTMQVSTSMVRAASTTITAGLGNFVVSTAEALLSLLLSAIALIAPIVAPVVIFVILLLVIRGSWRKPSEEVEA